MKSEAQKRGEDLLLALNLELDQVVELKFSIDKFKNAAAAKSWSKNHGFDPSVVKQHRDSVVVRVKADDEFEEGTIQRQTITRGVTALVGVPKLWNLRKAVPDADASNEEKRKAQSDRSEKWGIEALEGKGENLSFPSDFPTDENDYGDPVNLKFPTEPKERAANARVRFKQFADTYEEEKSKKVVHERIVRAELKHGIEPSFDEDDPLDQLLPQDLKDRLSKRLAVKRATIEVEFAKRGDLLIRKSEEGDPEDSVRMFGIVMKPEVPDSEGDVTSKEEIERGNFTFMTEHQTLGFMHKKDVSDRVKMLQNVLAPITFDFPTPDGGAKKIAEGTWYQELYTDDPELVKRVREGTLNGLSIGGKAKREPITEMVDGSVRLLPDLPFADQQKRALEAIVTKRNENVNKGEGDPALARFTDLRVEEVSLVDAAANEEDFFLIKRRKEMAGEQKPKEAAVTKDNPTAGDPPTTNADPTPTGDPKTTNEPTNEPTIAQQVAEGVKEGVKAAITEIQGTETKARKSAPADPPADDPVTKGFESLNSRLDGIDKRLDEQDQALKDAANVKAAAKGQSVPDGTTKTQDPEESKPDSKWAGTAVHSVFGKRR